MNTAILIGRLTKDPVVKVTQGSEPLTVARYTLAVDRPGKKVEGAQNADFIPCVAFGHNGEFAEKYLRQGTKIAVEGFIRTGSYDKDGQRIYTTDVVVTRHEFCEPKKQEGTGSTGFMQIPDGMDIELPFK